MNPAARILAATILPFMLFLAHAFAFGRWIVDDAGISYAYARSLASGHGFVSQAGQPPVEGFTNLLWVVLLAIPIRLQLFDPVVTPKLLSAGLALLSFALVAALLIRASGRPAWLAAAALSMTAASTGFVVWSISGLENGLYACLVALLCFVSVRIARGGDGVEPPGIAGFLLFLLFITRPDGVLYLPLVPLLLGLTAVPASRGRMARLYAATFLLPWCMLTTFRVLYFRDVLPNTYYAKRAVGWDLTARWMGQQTQAAGIGYCALMAIVIIAVVWLSVYVGSMLRKLVRAPLDPVVVLCGFFTVAFVGHHLLPRDWMPAGRFATPAILLGPAAILGALTVWVQGIPARPRMWFRAAVAAVLLVVASQGVIASRRLLPSPTISLDEVRDLSRRLASTAASAGIREPTVLMPDVGGALWEDRFRVIDLGGLSDRVIGRTLFSDRAALYEYIFGTRRPDLIWIHTYPARFVALPRDPRLGESYFSVLADSQAGGGIPEVALYVRKDRVRVTLDSVRRAFARPPGGPGEGL